MRAALRHPRSILVRLGLAASCMTLGSAAWAQPAQPAAAQPAAAQPAADDAQVLEARRAYDEGSAHFNAGRFAEALEAFRRAHTLRPNPVVLIPILECHERLQQVPEAIGVLTRYLQESPSAPNRAALETRLEALRARPARLEVRTTPPGASVLVDDATEPRRAPATMQVSAGSHRVRVTLDGHTPEERSVELQPGGREMLQLTLTPTAPTPPTVTPDPTEAPPLTTSRGTSPVVYVAAGLAGAGLIAGTVFGVMALDDANTYSQTPTRELLDRGERNAMLADVGFLTAVAASAVAVVVYFSTRSPAEARPAPTAQARHTAPPAWSLSPAGVSLRF